MRRLQQVREKNRLERYVAAPPPGLVLLETPPARFSKTFLQDRNIDEKQGQDNDDYQGRQEISRTDLLESH